MTQGRTCRRLHDRAARRRGAAAAPMLLAIASLLVSGAALYLVVTKDPGVPGKSISEYDFSTPKAAVRSQMEMDANGDVRAMMEFARRRAMADEKKNRKRLKSLEFGELLEHEDKTAVLYKVTDEDKDRHRVTWLEKLSDGNYYRTMGPFFDWREKHPEKAKIQKTIQEWRDKDTADEKETKKTIEKELKE